MAKSEKKTDLLRCLVCSVVFMVILGWPAASASAKSLYLLFDKRSSGPPSIQAYDVEDNGGIVLLAEEPLQRLGVRAKALALDSDNSILFVTHFQSSKIQLFNAKTMVAGAVIDVAGATSLAGIAYDHAKKRVYCVEQDQPNLYAFDWSAAWQQLTPVAGSPFMLEGATADGISLDTLNDLLYVASTTAVVRAYNASDWTLARSVTLSRPAVTIAVDAKNQIFYTGAGYLQDFRLLQYDLVFNLEKSVFVDPLNGVQGLTVDHDLSYVYFATGALYGTFDNGINARDKNLTRHVNQITARFPADLVISGTASGYNPLNLSNRIVEGTGVVDGKHYAYPGDIVKYETSFTNSGRTQPLTDVKASHPMPAELKFITAEPIEGNLGVYNPETRTYTVQVGQLQPGARRAYRLVCQVLQNLPPNVLVRQTATVTSQELPPIARSADLTTRYEFKPLSLQKKIVDGVQEMNNVYFAEAGTDVVYELTIGNKENPWPASTVAGIDELPTELEFRGIVGQNDANAVYVPNLHSLTFDLPRLDSGVEQRILYRMHVPEGTAPGTMAVNRAQVSSDQTGITRATTGLTVTSSFHPIEVEISLGGGSSPGEPVEVQPGQQLQYQIIVRNTSLTQPMTDITVAAQYSQGLIFVSANPNSGQQGLQSYTWHLDVVNPGQTVNLLLVLQVGQGLVGGTSLVTSIQALVAGNPVSQDSQVVIIPLENLRQVVTAVTADGQVVLPGEVGCVVAGEVFNYRILVGNPDNSSTVHNVTVLDTLPSQVDVLATEPNGIYNPNGHVAFMSYPQLGPSQEGAIQITVRAKSNLPIGTFIRNRVEINSEEFDMTRTDVDVQVCEQVVNADETQSVYNASYPTNQIIVTMTLPETVSLADIDLSIPMMVMPGRVLASKVPIVGFNQGRVVLRAFFEADPVRQAVGQPGAAEITAEGRLRSGRRFVGKGTVVFPH